MSTDTIAFEKAHAHPVAESALRSWKGWRVLFAAAGLIVGTAACVSPIEAQPRAEQAVDAAKARDQLPPAAEPKSAVAPKSQPTPAADKRAADQRAVEKAPAAAESVAPRVVLDAVAGEPYGVGQLTVEFPAGTGPIWFPDQAIQVAPEGRCALYPSLEVRYESAANAPKYRVSVFRCCFLFHGEKEIQVALVADKKYAASVRPIRDPQRHRGLTEQWWSEFGKIDTARLGGYDGPTLVRDYLRGMFQRRLNISEKPAGGGGASLLFDPVPLVRGIVRVLIPFDNSPQRDAASTPPAEPSLWDQLRQGRLDADFGQFLGILFGMESVRAALQADSTLSDSPTTGVADQEMPPATAPPSINVPQDFQPMEVETIAYHVPEECFYLRVGSVADYFWFRNFLTGWGGSHDRVIHMRAIDYDVRRRVERQLAIVADGAFRKDLEGCVSDMALIGADVSFNEGATIGVLWETSNSAALEALLARQRKAAWEAARQALERKVDIAGHTVTLLSTPDNTIRSFHAMDGNYHLVTNSSYLVRRFFEVGGGVRNLAGLAEFRYARAQMPPHRDAAVFLYLSDPFFRALVGPQYRVEMTRRMRALGDLQCVRMAQLAAAQEGVQATTPAELIRAGFLPESTLDRCDGSRPVLQDGQLLDSLRGAAGVFIPVPDLPPGKVTSAEAAAYQRFAEKYRTQWQRMDPVSVGMTRRVDAEHKREHVSVDLHITPYAREHYQTMFQTLGPPQRQWRSLPQGDLLAIDARVANLQRLWSAIPFGEGYLFAGVRDFSPPCVIRDGQVETVPLSASSLLGADFPAYLGFRSQVQAGDPLARLDRHPGAADATGYSHSRDAMAALLESRWRDRDTTMWAHLQETLQAVAPPAMEETGPPAQLRLRVNDLGRSKFGATLQAISYMHARRISATNTQFLGELSQQLGVPPAEARAAAEALLGAKLVCPLGGEYQLDRQGATSCWKSAAWSQASLYQQTAAPEGYRFSFLEWLHGAEIYFTLTPTVLSAHADLDLTAGAEAAAASTRFHPAVAAVPPAPSAPLLRPESPPRRGGVQAETELTRLEVEVPSEAVVVINGTVTSSRGVLRRFVTAGLTPGVTYPYEVRVFMRRDGKWVTQLQRVELGARETRRVAFTPANAAPAAPALAEGDVALVVAHDTALALGEKELARISRGRRMTVIEVKGPWVGTSWDQNGRQLEGWVSAGDVVLLEKGPPR